jgi:hypothetical protein
MSRQRTGLRFEVFINGRRACISGMDGHGVLDVVLTRVKRSPAAYPGRNKHPLKLSKAAWSKERIDVSVGGLDSTAYLHWLRRDLGIGDEISIKLLPPGKYDAPKGNRRRLTTRSRGTGRKRPAPHRER